MDPGTGVGATVDGVVVKTYGYGTSYNVSGSNDYRGHDWVTVSDAAGHYGKSYFYTRDAANGRSTVEVTHLQTRPYLSETYAAGASSWTTREETDWDITFTRGLTQFPHVEEVRSYVRTQGGGTQSRKVRYSHDGYGNVVSVKEYDSATAGVDLWARNRVTEYYPSTSNRYLAGYPAREALLEPNGDALRDTRYCYDGSARHDNPIGSWLYGDDGTQRARLTAVRRVLDAARSVDVTYGYDGFGHRVSMTEYNGYGVPGGPLATADPRTSTATFETVYQSYPYSVTNPLGHQATRSYDARWGVVTQATDPNGGVSDYSYDGWGRLTKVEGPEVAGPTGSYRPTTQYSYNLPSTTASGRTTTMLKSQVRTDTGRTTSTWRSSWAFYDGIGRMVQRHAEVAGGVNVSNGYYGDRGLKVKDSVPHFATGSDAFLEGDWAGYSGAATSYVFDELGRVTQTTLPDGQTTQSVYDGRAREGIDQKGHKRRYESDWAGRLVAVKEYTGSGPSYQLYATTTYGYDLANQLLQVTDAAGNRTTISYDGLGRKVGMVDPDMGTWSYEYDPIGTLSAQTDAREQRVELAYDALNRLVRKWYPAFWNQEPITEGHKPSVHDLMELRSAVDVDRGAVGLSTGVWTDPEIVAGRDVPIRAVHFTELRSRIEDLWIVAGMGTFPEFSAGPIVSGSRKIATSDPEDLRSWLREYEESGYGQIRRARAYYQYDEYDGVSQFGRGRRTAMWDMSGQERVYYDGLGRVYKAERILDGHSYVSRTSYDALSRSYQATLPDNEVLTYSYGPNGLLSQMVGTINSVQTTYVSGVEYNELSLPKRYLLGGSSPVSHSYYGLDYTSPSYPFGALRTIQWPEGSGSLVDRTMGYDPVGNVTSIDDGVNGESISYGYDDLDRLLSAGAPVSESYSYNQIGNLTANNGQPLTYGDPAHVHAVTAFGSASYGYDANGCMVTRASQVVRYDPERRPVRVDENGVTVWRATYDGDGSRRKRLDGKGTIHYLGSYERSVGNGQDTTETITKYYSAFGRTIALRKNGVLSYVGTDHLGGTIRVADSSFAPLDQMRYTPYGVDRDPGMHLDTDHKFTSQIEDESVGLYWYASRAYDPMLGRFTAPDMLVPGGTNPQALNRYSYVFNNPQRYVDASGHFAVVPFLIAAGIGAGIGAAAGLAGYCGTQVLLHRPVDVGDAVIATVAGAVGGAGAAAGPIAAILFGGVAGFAQYYRTETSHGREPQVDGMLLSTAFGLVGGKFGGAFDTDFRPFATNVFDAALDRFTGYVAPGTEKDFVRNAQGEIFNQAFWALARTASVNLVSDVTSAVMDFLKSRQKSSSSSREILYNAMATSVEPIKVDGMEVTVNAGDPSSWTATIPASQAPGGVGVVGITPTNTSGSPEGGGNWVSPGGANAAADSAARRAAWERAGSPDYNSLRAAGVAGY